MEIPDNWLPTPTNINALPEPVRKYIHQLQTRTDPAGDVRRIAELKDMASAIEALYLATKVDLLAVSDEVAELVKAAQRTLAYYDGLEIGQAPGEAEVLEQLHTAIERLAHTVGGGK